MAFPADRLKDESIDKPQTGHLPDSSLTAPGADPTDLAITSLADDIKAAVREHRVHLTGKEGLDFCHHFLEHLTQWDVMTKDDRRNLKEFSAGKTHQNVSYLLDALPRLPDVEVVLIAKVIIETGQGHQLGHIGLSTTKVKAVNEQYCVKVCKAGK